MAYLTREQILESQDIYYEEVEVPEWGGAVLVRSISSAERDRFELEAANQRETDSKRAKANIRALLCSWAIVSDRGGKRLFQRSDVEALGKKSAAALNRVFDVAARLAAITEADVEELAENLDEGQSDDFSSD